MKRLIFFPLIFLSLIGFTSISCLSESKGAVLEKSASATVEGGEDEEMIPSRTAIEDPTEKLVDIIAQNGIRKSDLKIHIDKSEYYLAVKHKDSVLIKYPCVFGFNAVDDKAMEGDGCTPEGEFGVRSMYAHKSWKYFIWIDYPNAESWRRFKKRKADGDIPSDATIGGEVGIHGVPEGMDSMIEDGTNWTLGCISLKNAHITDLYKSINRSTKIEIVP
ncbi:MAG: L,D-transpeptidase [bacterium]|nr:L,D-transpeptidase [bacterium]